MRFLCYEGMLTVIITFLDALVETIKAKHHFDWFQDTEKRVCENPWNYFITHVYNRKGMILSHLFRVLRLVRTDVCILILPGGCKQNVGT